MLTKIRELFCMARLWANPQIRDELQRQTDDRRDALLGRFISIPSDGIFTNGLHFDDPNETLPWYFSHEECREKILRGKYGSEANVRFMGFPFQCLFMDLDGASIRPIRRHVSSIHLFGPFRKFDAMTKEYDAFSGKLFDLLGQPTIEMKEDSIMWPKHIRRKWDLGYSIVSHSISDIKDSDPVNQFSIQRRYKLDSMNREILSKW